MKKTAVLAACVLGAMACGADPGIEDVTFSQDVSSLQATVTYALTGDEPAIVTLDVLTNGVSVGAANIRSLVGDVNRMVQPGEHTILWRPDKSWPGHLLTDGEMSVAVKAWPESDPPDYMMIDISLGSQTIPAADRVTYYECADAIPFPGGVTNDLCKTDYLVMRRCHATGVPVRIGTSAEEHWADSRWTPHYVTLTNDFWIGVYEVTQRQYQHFCGSTNSFATPSYFTADAATRPVENIAMFDLRGWSNDDDGGVKVSAGTRKLWPETGHEILPYDCTGRYGHNHTNILWLVRQITGMDFDLPTDAQWEIAARAGKGGNLPDGTAYYKTVNGENGLTRVRRYARFFKNSQIAGNANTNEWPAAEGGTAKVGSYLPNAWGLYDVCGNVAELCLDNYGTFTTASEIDPLGPATPLKQNSSRVLRGGSWMNETWEVEVNERRSQGNNARGRHVGFRLCLTIP